MSSEQLQKEHYDRIAALYEAHYWDTSSVKYRLKFIYDPLFEGLDLAGKRVLDAMCGGGSRTVSYLLSKGARVTGLDISGEEIKSFQKFWPDCEAVCASILDSGFEDETFDCVAVIGGLHHMHPRLNETVEEIHRILKVGGLFCFMEPYTGSAPDQIRKLWYKHDPFFEDNEAAINLNEMKKDFAAQFVFNKEEYLGNLAYLFVLNSMIFRVPLRLKAFYARPLISIESLINKVQGKLFSCFVICQWQKR